MRCGRDPLLAVVGGGRDPDLAPRSEAREFGQFAPVGRQRGGVELDVAGNEDPGCAERRQPLAIAFAPREAQVETRQQRADQAGRAAPAVERALAYPPVDHRERRTGPLQFDDHVRPEFGFCDQRGVGAPVGEKPAQKERAVQRGVLMQRAGGQALRQERGGGHGSRRHQRTRARARDALDEGQERNRFADARSMQPDEAPGRTGQSRTSPPFADAPRIFLAAFEPNRKKRPRERCAERSEDSIGVERQGRRHAILRFAPGSVAPTMA